MRANEQKQHVDMHRKIMLRKRLLKQALPGAAYVPFIGDGDIAADLYADRLIYGADLDVRRAGAAADRLPDGIIVEADCDAWPFAGYAIAQPFAVCDFDAYAYPYASFRAWWESDAPRADKLVLFFTDGQHQSVIRNHHVRPFAQQQTIKIDDLKERRRMFNMYLRKYVLPAFTEYIAPWRVVQKAQYLRGMMLYWGAVIAR